MSKPIYPIDEVINAAHTVMDGNKAAMLRNEVTREAAQGAEAGILALLLILDIDIQFSDGTRWSKNSVYKPGDPPKLGRERMN